MNPIEALRSQQSQLQKTTDDIVLKLFNDVSERTNITSVLQNIINKCYQFLELETSLSSYQFDCIERCNDQSFSSTLEILNHYIKDGVMLADSISIFDWFILKSEVSYFLSMLTNPNITKHQLYAVFNAANFSLIKNYSLNDGLCIDTVNPIYNHVINSLTSMDYNDYLNTKHWKTFSRKARDFFGHKCSKCGRSIDLNVHHKNYACLGKETYSDVSLLCNKCHKIIHSKL